MDQSILKSSKDASQDGLLRLGDVPLSEREQSIIHTIEWNVPESNEYVGNTGYFSTGSIKDVERESVIARLFVEGFELGGAAVNILSADRLLTDPSAQDLVRRTLSIGDAIGVREAGKPRVIIVTGFAQSKFLTSAGVASALDHILKSDYDEKKIEQILTSPVKETTTTDLFPEYSDTAWALLLARRYMAGSSWQAVAARKNSHHETIILITVGPDEIFRLVNAYQTNDLLVPSDMVKRWEEGIYSPPSKI
ncbi:MAG: hypothetical protein WC654_01545 [Patescibacteria group bacterium]